MIEGLMIEGLIIEDLMIEDLMIMPRRRPPSPGVPAATLMGPNMLTLSACSPMLRGRIEQTARIGSYGGSAGLGRRARP